MKDIPTGDNSKKSIKQQQRDGEWYEALGDAELIQELHQCEDLCFAYNNILPSKAAELDELIRRILGKSGKNINVHSPSIVTLGIISRWARISLPTLISLFLMRTM